MKLVHRMLEIAKRAETPASEAPAGEKPAESRTRSFVVSTETVDSYNTVIKSDAWQTDRFDKNPVIFFAHRSREFPIGKGTGRVDGAAKQFLMDIDFFTPEVNPLSEQALRILDQGVMGCSVGFEPLSWEYNKERETGDEFLDYYFPPLDYTAVRLLEVSVVSIPANPDAFPVGREAVQARFLERLDARRATPIVAPAPAAIVTPAPTEDFRSMVERITREEKQAQAARRSGKTSRS